jgi:hypothetical protein
VGDPRLARGQLRTNGELLLRRTPPDGVALRAVESSSWSEGWTPFYELRPDLRPHLELTETVPRERLSERLAELLPPDREHVVVVSLHGHPDAVGVGAAAVAGPGNAVTGYVVGLVEDGEDDLFVLDEPAGTVLYVDQDGAEQPRGVLVQRYRWPEFED